MGSKRKLLPAISDVIDRLQVKSALDAFSGSSCVAYLMKQKGLRVTANDFLTFAYQIAHATIENNHERLDSDDISLLMRENPNRNRFIETTFRNLYFSNTDNRFLDLFWANLSQIRSPYKRSLALAAAHRACLKRRPRGVFTYTGPRYDDGRADLRKTLKQQFIEAAQAWNNAIFDNGQPNRAFNEDVFELEAGQHDLVYIDPPYLTPRSDNEYTRRYHFVEGLATYWRSAQIQTDTVTKKIKRKETPFGSKQTVYRAFDRVFEKFSDSILLVSYGSAGIPNRNEIVDILQTYKRRVRVYEYDYVYSFGTHSHKLNNTSNRVSEYLFLAR